MIIPRILTSNIASDITRHQRNRHYNGYKLDARLYSVGANHNHGLRRTNEDKRKAVQTLLDDPEWCKWSDREIARQCHVDNKTVSKLRSGLTEEILSDITKISLEEEKIYTDKYGNESVMNVANIGYLSNEILRCDAIGFCN